MFGWQQGVLASLWVGLILPTKSPTALCANVSTMSPCWFKLLSFHEEVDMAFA